MNVFGDEQSDRVVIASASGTAEDAASIAGSLITLATDLLSTLK